MSRFLMLPVVLLLTAALVPVGGSGETETEYIELKAPAPEWWTPEVEAAAIAAAEDGMLLNPLTGEHVAPAAAPAGGVPYGAPDYLFIRPGALGLIGGALCTYNFIYESGTQIGTAGHCVGRVGQTAFIVALPAPTVPLVTALGTVSEFRNGGVGDDWALIDINPAWHSWVDPNMAYLGGPTCAAWDGSAVAVKSVGHGIQTGLILSVPRVSEAADSNGRSFQGIGLVSGGDSGSPVVEALTSTDCSGGAAAGVVTHCLGIIAVCLPLYVATDIRLVPATVTTGFDPL